MNDGTRHSFLQSLETGTNQETLNLGRLQQDGYGRALQESTEGQTVSSGSQGTTEGTTSTGSDTSSGANTDTKTDSTAHSTEGEGAAASEHGEGSIEEHHQVQLDVVMFLFLCLVIGQIMKKVNSITGIPFTSLVTIVGLIFGMT